MKLYIIGNGFDRAHGLPTQYWDFRSFLEDIDPSFLYLFESHYNIYPNSSEAHKKNLLWNEFETNLANIDEDDIIHNALSLKLNIEDEDWGIEDHMRIYFREEFDYIKKLAKYTKDWIKTIKIDNISPRTSKISQAKSDCFITFNYTSVLEKIYNIDDDIIYIHGSLNDRDDDPILGHGNWKCIQNITARKNHAEISFNEKETSICTVLKEYYNTTFKNVNNYMHKINSLYKYNFNEIIVIGHSLAGVDLPYFKRINDYTRKKCDWTVYYYDETKKEAMLNELLAQGISHKKIKMLPSANFFDL